jgi:glycosyltransferase involved in cell wall biosynthesis
MRVSVITVTYNSAGTLKDTIESVQRQSHRDVEHVLVDGSSVDQTVSVIRSYSHITNWRSEPDRGLYDAINKGILMSSGEIIGILNSDDFFPNESVLSRIASEFENPDVDAVIGDIAFVRPDNLKRIVRHYSARNFHAEKFVDGFMPPHPSFYVRKEYYEKLGLYKLDYKIAADYELLIRFLKTNKLRYKYIPEIMVYMRTGGVSNQSVKSRYILNEEIIKACAENGINTNMLRLSLKYFNKIFEYVGPMFNKDKSI